MVSPRGDVRKAENPGEILSEVTAAILQLIPLGKVVTYKAIAEVLGVHPRHVGALVRGNTKPIAVPCHRVVMSDGRLGRYTLNGRKAVEFKKRLLMTEGVMIRDGKVVKDFIVTNLIT